MPSRWPTVTRQRHLDTLSAALRPNGSRSGIVVTGGAGVGKTTLARHALKDSRAVTRWVAGTETAKGIPLGAFAHLVDVADPREPHSILRAARENLLAGNPDVVIGVDDAHMLDQLSATVVHQLAMEHAANFVVTVRTGQSVPDAITALWKDDLLTRLDLAPFTRDEVIEVVENALEGPLESVSADRLFAISQGNPLFLRHIVEGAVDAGRLRQTAGVWQLRGQTVIGPQLSTLIEGRLADVSEEARTVAELLAFAGTLDLDLLTTLCDGDAVETAERMGLTSVIEQDGLLTVTLTSPIFAEVIRSKTGVLKARRIRGQLVRAMSGRRLAHVSDRIRMVSLALESDQPPNLGAILDSAGAALTLGEISLGERFARRAAELDGSVRTKMMLAQALAWQGDGKEAESVLENVDIETLNELELIMWGTVRAANLFWMIGDPEAADAVLTQVRPRLMIPAARDFVDMYHATFTGRTEEALKAARAVLDSPFQIPIAQGWASFTWATAQMQVGNFAEVGEFVERGLRGAAESESGLLRFNLGLAEVPTLAWQGDLDGAEAAAKRYVGFAVGQQPARAKAGVLLGQVALARGELDSARDEFTQAIAALQDVGYSWEFLAAGYLCQTYAALGRAKDATIALDRAERLVGGNEVTFGPELEVARAWLAAAQGESSAAITHAHAGADMAAATGRWAVEANARYTAVRLGDRTAAPRLAELAAMVEGEFADTQARQAAALAADDGAELAEVAAVWEEMGALLWAADAAAQAAIVFNRAGDRRGELSASGVAYRLAQYCGDAKTPALIAESNPLPLTSREREIASMVALGLSNKEIADRLTVSVRTVEGHIYRSCIKLDVADRDALARTVMRVTR